MRTTDGGATWQAHDMSAHATILIDIYFTDADNGWVVGGKAALPAPPNPHDPRSHIKPVVLHTSDGGQTWTNMVAALTDQFPLGEWGWKIHFLDDRIGYISLENFTQAAILKTVDGGHTWTRIEVHDPQGNANLEGIGFLDENTGWVGGWGSHRFPQGFLQRHLRRWPDMARRQRDRAVHQPVQVLPRYPARLRIGQIRLQILDRTCPAAGR